MKLPANDNSFRPPVLPYLGQRLISLEGWGRTLALLLLGGMVTLALPPFFAWGFLLIAFPGLLWLVMHAPTAQRRFWDGWWFGFGFFTTGLYWFAHALLVDAAKFGWLIPFAVFGIGGILAIYTGLATWLTGLLRHHDRFNWLISFPTVWTVVEWLRGLLFTGFPWNLTGYVFNASDASLQAASLVGAYGLSWLAVFFASLPVLFMFPKDRRSPADVLFVGNTLLLLFALLGWGNWRLEAHPLAFEKGVKLRIVQPAIDQYHKSRPEERLNILRELGELTRADGIESVTHVIWPETAMPFYFSSGDSWARELASLLPPGALLLTGVVRPELDPEHQKLRSLFNSFQVMDVSGTVLYTYDKRKLVPFGEFVPLRHILPLDKITPGAFDFTPGTAATSYQPPHGPGFAPLICYESIFPSLAEGAWPQALVNVTNDGWFGISTGPYQHLEMSRMRAVEQGVAFIRAANSGVSAVFDGYGRRVATFGLAKKGILDAPLPQATKIKGLYATFGAFPLAVLLLVALIILILRRP